MSGWRKRQIMEKMMEVRPLRKKVALKEFITEALPVSLIGMNQNLMK